MLSENPLVSIVLICKNGARTIRRPIEAALAQTYPNLEFVIQDGASTDGTLEIVREYMERYPGRIRLISEPDSCGEEGFFRGLRACRGEIIAPAMADEEVLPETAAQAVEQLRLHPEMGAVYGDVHLTDLDGKVNGSWIAQPFSFAGYLCREVDPPLASSFFRREALLEIGLLTRNWVYGIGEYELWLRLGMKYPILYVPGFRAKYAIHPGASSAKVFAASEKCVEDRTEFFRKFFAEPDLPPAIQEMQPQAQAGLHLFMAEVLVGLREYDKARTEVLRAMNYRTNGPRLLQLALKISRAGLEWDLEMLRVHIQNHLAPLPPRRIICYGAGNDFLELIASGLFDTHTLVAVVDNKRPKGSLVGGVPVIGEADLGQTDHDLLVITSSQWAYELRTSAMRRTVAKGLRIPII